MGLRRRSPWRMRRSQGLGSAVSNGVGAEKSTKSGCSLRARAALWKGLGGGLQGSGGRVLTGWLKGLGSEGRICRCAIMACSLSLSLASCEKA